MSQSLDLVNVLAENEKPILQAWIALQLDASNAKGLIKEADLRLQAGNFLSALRSALQENSSTQTGPAWDEVRTFLAALSRSRAQQGFSPSETASFVFSLKQPLFSALEQTGDRTNGAVGEALMLATKLLDNLGLFTFEAFQKGREQVIQRQQEELLELSTPVVELWKGILALPLIGTLDSERTQTVMESLLEGIVEHEATIAIIDITGVPTVDTLVAQHLLKTVAAARLMGAECIISGIRPQIAQTIVHLGVELGDVITKSSLSEALKIALHKTGLAVTSVEKK